MHFSKPISLLLISLATSQASPQAEAEGCGDADGCVLTDICKTATLTVPATTTTITTCAPTATCLGVYSDCTSGGQIGNCCSGYCAASKCRSTDPKWPNCQEDMGPCLVDDNCCYGNKCDGGFCTRP